MDDLRGHWEERYRQGGTPWDTRITPPEVVQFWDEGSIQRRGLAVDLGCGTGTNVLFLANLGLRVLGFDCAGNALAVARRRLYRQRPGLSPRVHLVQADVVHLPLLGASAVYVLDIGCLHSIEPPSRKNYAKNLLANLAPGGFFHLFGFDQRYSEGDGSAPAGRGLAAGEVETLFCPALEVVQIIQGEPQPHPASWYLLRKSMASRG